MDLKERAAYLKGLAKWLEFDDPKREEFIKELLAFVEDAAAKIDENKEHCDMLEDYCDELDEDLGEVEEYLCEDDECCCDDDEHLYTVVCPHCGESFFLDDDDFEEGVVDCPYCEKEVEIGDRADYVKDLDEEDDCDCGCCDSHGKN